MVTGYIHSTESFGAADGPGVRFIVFMQGCPMRCAYCHNPDTWDIKGGEETTAEQVIKTALRYRSYWRGGGGITVSGGEPLMQIDFVTELFRLAHDEGVNTALDTAGSLFTKDSSFIEKFDELMKYTDLVILDLKEIDPARHKKLTGFLNTPMIDMAQYLSGIKKPMWIRHVLVPGVTDFDEDLDKLGEFISGLDSVERVEVLPYHTLGVHKWEALGIDYPLADVKPPINERVKNAEKRIGAK